MSIRKIIILWLAIASMPSSALYAIRLDRYDAYDVVWESQSPDSFGAMPTGNGDIGCNVWVTESGAIECYIGKTDAFSELNSLLKIGKLSITTSPNLLDGARFRQRLDIKNGVIEISGSNTRGSIALRFWVDANAPVIRLEGNASVPVELTVRNAAWRTSAREIKGSERHTIYGLYDAPYPTILQADTLPVTPAGIAWAHHNRSSIYRETLERQHLGEWYDPDDDPLLYRTFGALCYGPGLRSADRATLVSERPRRQIDVSVVVTACRAEEVGEWLARTEKTADSLRRRPKALQRHKKWWNDFWLRHYLFIESEEAPEEAYDVTRAYILQRYMNASAGRGRKPIKFNGSIFNVDLARDFAGQPRGLDADFRLWGGPYWWQNTRLPYYSMLFSGDWEMMVPLFEMYREALPLARFRTRKYFGHDGAYFPETMCFWGTYAIDNYGWERQGLAVGIPENRFIRYYYQSNIELVSLMLEYYKFTSDRDFAEHTLFPFAGQVLTFYDLHYPKTETGRMEITPAQSLETYFEGVSNPLPDVAGLRWITRQLLLYCHDNLPEELAMLCNSISNALPPIPTRVEEGQLLLTAGDNLGARMNVEKPELYALFPYRWYGVGEPGLDVARQTYERRPVKEFWGWQQDGIFAANLGLADEARRIATANCRASNREFRFPVMWGPNYDWTPDQDHGSVFLRTVQNMLIQYGSDNRIHLLPAWPEAWEVTFRVYGPLGAEISGTYDPQTGARIDEQHLDKSQELTIHNPRKKPLT